MVSRDVIRARDEEIYTFIAGGGTYHQAAARWQLKVSRIHEIVRGVAQTTRLARQETAIDDMIQTLDQIVADSLIEGTPSAMQAAIKAQDQKAKLLGLYTREDRRSKQAADDAFSAWDYVESDQDG